MREFRIIPPIFSTKGFDPAKMLRGMHYPIRIFSHHDHRKVQQGYKGAVRTLIQNLKQWEEFTPIRSHIEDVFKLAKEAFSVQKIHRHSRRSVAKIVAGNVLLVGATIAAGVDE